jgi:hypothetical protein
LRAVSDAIVILAGRCHVGHKNANRPHAHGSACTLVAATQGVAWGLARTSGFFYRCDETFVLNGRERTNSCFTAAFL